MTKYVLTSPKFDGQISFWYTPEGALVHYSNNLPFTYEQHLWLLKRMPLLQDGIEPLRKTIHGTLAILPADISFDCFWLAYDKKINRKRCEPLYEKLNDGSKMLCLLRLPAYKAYCQRTKYRNLADPEKYIRDRYFETDWNKER